MGMAACAEVGDSHGLFQPAHGSAPDIMGQDKANPLVAILSGGLMLDYLDERYAQAGECIAAAVDAGFVANTIRQMEFGGDMGTRVVTQEVSAQVDLAPHN